MCQRYLKIYLRRKSASSFIIFTFARTISKIIWIMNIKTIDDYNFSGTNALMRVDFIVPVNAHFRITDDSRIRGAIPSIRKILSEGGAVILMSHFGRPKGGFEEKYSLKHILPHLSKLLKLNVKFSEDCVGDVAELAAADLQAGEVLLLENLRFHKEEEAGKPAFAKKLARLGNVYVNDAFGTAHRAHASTSIIADYFPGNKVFGYLMAAEITNAEKLMNGTEKPFTAIIGGAKVSDKILVIERLLEKVDNLIIGGGMAYTFEKAKGGETGNSLLETDKVDVAKAVIKAAGKKKVKLFLPEDSIVADAFSNEAEIRTEKSNAISTGWMGLDIGPIAIEKFSDVIKNSKSILWNGPMGVFEMEKFETGTKAIARSVAEASKNGAYSLVGGGDSAAAIHKFGYNNDVSYVSTGGGALLEYFEGKELPGIKYMLK
jgi:phosphoglycerate kinase